MPLNWYNHLVEPKDGSGKPFLFKYETVVDGNVLICQETNHHIFARFQDIIDLINYISKVKYSHNCFFEVIRGTQPHKWYADIDIMLEGKSTEEAKCILPEWETVEVVKHVKLALLKILPAIKEEDILIASSNGIKKHSYHVVIDKWCTRNKEESKAIFKMVVDELPDRYKSALDPVVYKSIQQFRLYGSHKYQSDRVKVFREDLSSWKPGVKVVNEEHLERLRFLAFLVGNYKSCNSLPCFVEENPYRSLEDDGFTLEKEDVKETMRIFRATYPNSGVFTYLSYNGRFISLKRNSPSYCKVCQRSHEHENPYIFIVGEARHIYFDCRRADADKGKLYLGRLGAKEEAVPLVSIEEKEYKIPAKKDILAGFTVNGKSTAKDTEDIPSKHSEDTPIQVNKTVRMEDSTSEISMSDVSSEDTDTMVDSPVKVIIRKKSKPTHKNIIDNGGKIINLLKKEKKPLFDYRSEFREETNSFSWSS
jgi:hypothetical protein